MPSIHTMLCLTTLLSLSALTILGCEGEGESSTQEELDTLNADDAGELSSDAGEPGDEDGATTDLGPCSEEECGPSIGAPNYPCDDGVTIGGPGPCERQADGQCGWTMVQCPESAPCSPETCQSVPASCDGDRIEPALNMYCDPENGACVEETQDEAFDCAEVGLICVEGACVEAPDLCADVVCEEADSYCEGNTAVYSPAYACNPDTGACEAASLEDPKNCAELGLICLEGACVEKPDLCAGVVCEGMEAFCEGDVAYSAVYQECSPQSGECVSAPSQPPEDCSELDLVCVEGTCQSPLCDEEACGPMPGMPNTLCEDGVTMAGPGDCELQEGGACGWTIVECPDPDACTPGDTIEAGDGCNTCVCAESGLISESVNCTKKACVCQSSKECHAGFYCDFPNDDCGVWGGSGQCEAQPEACIMGGQGACGCGPISTTNGCEQQAAGYDAFVYGGCDLGDEETFACGEVTCVKASEQCTISMNDVLGPNEPLFFNTCEPLVDPCGQGDCSCIPDNVWSTCYGETGYTIVFYMGG